MKKLRVLSLIECNIVNVASFIDALLNLPELKAFRIKLWDIPFLELLLQMKQLEELIIDSRQVKWDILLQVARKFRYVCRYDKKLLIDGLTNEELDEQLTNMNILPFQFQFRQKQFRCHLL